MPTVLFQLSVLFFLFPLLGSFEWPLPFLLLGLLLLRLSSEFCVVHIRTAAATLVREARARVWSYVL